MVIDFQASQPHYVDHLAPIWMELDDEIRGEFYAEGEAFFRATMLGIEVADQRAPVGSMDRPILGAALRDIERHGVLGDRPTILMEHGAGQSYSNGHSGYAGGQKREWIWAHLVPHFRVAALYPAHPRVYVIGCPKTDLWFNYMPPPGKPCLALSWHWDCRAAPEAGTAFYEYARTIPDIQGMCARNGIDLLGHAHPRMMEYVRPVYESLGIDVVDDFDQVAARATVYSCDNSSTMYEMASIGRRVVALNSKHWRRDVHHGLRFWDLVPGIQVNTPAEWVRCVQRAFEWHPADVYQGEQVSEQVYAFRGEAAPRAAQVLAELSRL